MAFVVIDGIDGSGKSTQFDLTCKYLEENKVDFRALSFPDYSNPSSTLVKMYLNGEISKNADDINPYATSSFYASDRYINYKKYWERDYLTGKFILSCRYTTSNLIHQTQKLPKTEWENYINWVKDYEFTRIGLPVPDLVIFLDMPAEISLKLIQKRGEGNDLHENEKFLTKSREAALYIAEKEKWEIISCGENGNPFPENDINSKIRQIISKRGIINGKENQF